MPTVTTDADVLVSLVPALRYQKEPVETLQDLYLKYPLGGEFGWYAFVKSLHSFAYWNIDILSWEKHSGNIISTKLTENSTDLEIPGAKTVHGLIKTLQENQNVQTVEINKRELSENKGASNGYPPLINGKIPGEFISGVIPTVVTVSSIEALNTLTGDVNIVYVTANTGLQYRFSGGQWVNINAGADKVGVIAQSFTTSQKLQARKNIGAVGAGLQIIDRYIVDNDIIVGLKNDDNTETPVNIYVGDLLHSVNSKLSDKVQLVQYSKNLFNPNSITYGFYINYSNGNTAALSGYAASDFIAVKPNTVYTKIKSDPNQEQLAYYDADKIFVSGISIPTNSLTTPSNAYYIRLSLKISNDDVNTTMFAEGTVTTYEPFLQAIDKNTPIVIQSRNLFDKSAVTDNYYVQYSNGALGVLSTYAASDFIAIKPNTLYTKFQSGDSEQLAFYDGNKNFVSGLTNIPTLAFTTPSNAHYIRFSLKKSTDQLNTTMFAEGVVSAYEPYEVKVLSYDVFKKYSYENFIVVAKSGGDFDTIQAAVNASNSSSSNPVTIQIMPGTYTESVDIRYKYISLVGVDKKNCIIQTNSGNYYDPPINMSGGCSLTNLTLIATHDDNPNFNNPWILPSYAVHHDAESEGTSRITNCILISHQHASIGIGLHNNQTLVVDNCELYNFTDISTEIQGALYCHNQQYAGAINQKLVVKNCRMESTKKCALRCEDVNHLAGGSANDAKDTVYSFYNNILWSHDYGIGTGVVDGLGGRTPLDGNSWIGYLKLGVDSFGNNVSFINK